MVVVGRGEHPLLVRLPCQRLRLRFLLVRWRLVAVKLREEVLRELRPLLLGFGERAGGLRLLHLQRFVLEFPLLQGLDVLRHAGLSHFF